MVLYQKYTRAEAARSLQINPDLITRWIQEHQADDLGQAFRGQGKLTPQQKEENKRLKLEKEVLKKAMVFFARETT